MNQAANREVEVFTEALLLERGQRPAYLDRACGSDAELRQKVEALLKAEDRVGDFLEVSPHKTPLQTKPEVSVGEKPGDRIGRYKLLQQIGEGGCGVVFMAEQEGAVRRRVAVKIIKPGMDTKNVIARFEAERQALALMDHPNIAKIFDAGATDSGRPYFVMELVRGIKITEYCDQHSLTTHERLKLFIQVCQAVQHAHQKGIIHRDIKPSNILVSQTEQEEALPVVIDFGIAKAITNHHLTDKTVFTASEMLMGTPAYMSPEQAALSVADVDTRSDIYSLGVLLYELLTGSTLFDTKKTAKAGLDEIRRVIREQEPVRPSTCLSRLNEADLTVVAQRRHSEPPTLVRVVRGDLDWIAMKALEKDRIRRYPTANGLALDIQRFLADETVSARPPSKVYKLQKTILRNKLLFAFGGAITLLLVVGLIIVSAGLARERQARREAEAASVKSQEITTLLEGALRGVGPAVSLGQDTRMLRGILDSAVERIDKEITNQPEVKAELQDVIGSTYWQIGNYRQAEDMHRAAAEGRRELFGSNDPRLAESLAHLSVELQAERKLPEAERSASEAVGILQNVYGSRNTNTATAMNDLSAIYRDEGNLAQSESLARQALAIRQEILGRTNLDVADSLRNLSLILGTQNKWSESEAMSREVLAMRRQILGPEHPWVASALNDLAWTVSGGGKLEEAERLQKEALAMRQKLLPEEDPDVALSLQLVGDTMRKLGNSEEAYSVLTAALSIQRKVLGEDDPASIETLRSMGLALGAQGKWSEAETIQSNVLVLSRKHSGNDSPRALFAMSDLGLALENEHKWPEAENLYRQALDMSPKILGPRDHFTLYIKHRLGLTLEGQGRWAEAESEHREAIAIRREWSGDEDVETLYAMRNLAETFEHEGKWAEAETIHRNLLTLWRKRNGDGDHEVLYTFEQLEKTLEAQNKWSDAEAVTREMLALTQAKEGNLAPDSLDRMDYVGLILEKEGKWPEAEAIHSNVLALWSKKSGDNDPHTIYATRKMGEMFEREGKLADAESFYRQEFEAWRKLAGNEDQQTFYSRRKLGLTLEAENKWPEAETVFRESMSLARKKGNEDPEALADLERLLHALMPQKKLDESEKLLTEVLTPTFVTQPTSAALLVQRIDLRGRQGRWADAAADSALVLKLEPDEHYDYHRLAALLAMTQNRPAYEQVCQQFYKKFSGTKDPFVAERLTEDCLLLPGSTVDLRAVDKLADTAVSDGSHDSALPYFQACKAMSNYRAGHYREAIDWAEKATKSSTADPQAKAKAFAVMAMANWQLGQKDAARAALANGDTLAPRQEATDLGDPWVAWIMARISLDEATKLIAGL